MAEVYLKEKEFWKSRITKELTASNIRLDFNRPNKYSGKTCTCDIDISADVLDKIVKLTGKDYFLLYTLLVSVVNICLHRNTGAQSIVIGSPVLASENDGKTINEALVIVNKINPSFIFRQFLLNVRTELLEAYKNQNYPLERLIDELGIEKKNNKSTLFDVAIELTNIHKYLDGIMNDMTFSFTFKDEHLIGKVVYNPDVYRHDSIQQFIKSFINILERSLLDTNTAIIALIQLTEEEKQQLLHKWNDTVMEYSKELCIHQLFEMQVEKTPDAIALCYKEKKLTYRELNQYANQLAYYLRGKGIGANKLVGLFIDRSVEMIIALLGVLKAGGTYVPIDPTYPKDRLASMLSSVELSSLLTRECLLERLPNYSGLIISIDKNWEKISRESKDDLKGVVSVKDTSYVIFTSGSTGTPKAAAVYHQGWTNLVNWFSSEYKINSEDKVLIISSFSFDITQRSIAMPLINGGELHLLASEYYDPELIINTICTNKITLLNCSPSTFYPLAEKENKENFRKLQSLRCLFLGGEAISPSRISEWATSVECKAIISNVYGAAECSDVSSFYHLKDFERYIKSSVPIGWPIYNTKVFILDENLNHVPPGVVGEICLAGDGVGKGYINDCQLTSNKFVNDLYSTSENARLYRTGDLGRFLPDGCLEYSGRVDYQVKIRGLRIELGDIESVLRQNPHIKEAVVIDKKFDEGDHRLISYITLIRGGERDAEDKIVNKESAIKMIRQFADEKLPNYMIPNFFIIMEELPLSPNGKIDRKSLKEQSINLDNIEYNDVQNNKHSEIEDELLGIFRQVLNVNNININDNIFHIGGHSLLVTQIVALVNSKLGLNLSTVDIYSAPSVSTLIERINQVMN